ncbi:MAG: hypothetical protein UH239_09665 [Acutalibacteraceae bacterium]|nr:hypothetical protein [Acutalibacteraceae bacterium]
MNINDKFSKVLSSIEFQLARSLPIFNDGNEILFFYKTDEINKTEYRVSEVRYVVFRNIDNGHIEVIKAVDALPKELIDALVESTNMHILSVEQELKNEDDYLELYEKITEEYCTKNYSASELQTLSALFLKLTEGTSLLPLYRYLGKEFFELISLDI